jgi:hypothetical protein
VLPETFFLVDKALRNQDFKVRIMNHLSRFLVHLGRGILRIQQLHAGNGPPGGLLDFEGKGGGRAAQALEDVINMPPRNLALLCKRRSVDVLIHGRRL